MYNLQGANLMGSAACLLPIVEPLIAVIDDVTVVGASSTLTLTQAFTRSSARPRLHMVQKL